MCTMSSQFSWLITAKKMVILLISQVENKNENQGNFFLLFSTNKFKQSPVSFHCTYPHGLYLFLARSLLLLEGLRT